jgi:3'(2'), 5'-bisphosphate nucleotidase
VPADAGTHDGGARHERELAAAVEAVQAASALCARAQGRLLAGDTLTKGDDSPVTVADFAAQAVVCSILMRDLGGFEMVGEEDAADLAGADRAALLDGVVGLVRSELGDDVTSDDVVAAIGRGGPVPSGGGAPDRFWTLDPIDGTKGFLRGDQYAIALALIEHGEVVLGVLGCPNLANPDGSSGATFVAVEGRCDVLTATGSAPVRVAAPTSLADARFCESVESGHSDQGASAQVAARLGIRAEPYRIDSQCKYGAVARGDASIYLRLPTRPGYVEKIWDHAAGMFAVTQAGGRVTDVTGAPLDFSRGARLEANRGVVATDGRFHDEVIAAVNHVLSG